MTDGLSPSYPLRTERLVLRPHRLDDLDDLYAFHSLPEVVRYVPWPVRDREQTRIALEAKLDQAELTEPGRWLVLAIELDGTVIGEVLLKWASDTDRQGEVGIALHPDYQGRGLASEAVREMLRLGFDDLGLHRIIGVCVDANTASAAMLGRLGFQLEAHLIHNIFFKNEWTNQLVYALREDDWRAGRTPADETELEQVVATFFAAFTSGPDVTTRLEALRTLFLPNAVIVNTTGPEPAVYTVDDFITPRQKLLTDGTLTGFTEHATGGHFESFGNLSHWFGPYTKRGVQGGTPFTAHGMKSLQFARTPAGWRITSATWHDRD